MTADMAEGFDESELDGTRWKVGSASCSNRRTNLGIESNFSISGTRKGGLTLIKFDTNEVTKAKEGQQLSLNNFYSMVKVEDNFQGSFYTILGKDILIEKVTDKFVVLKINELTMSSSYFVKITLKGTVVCRRNAEVSSEPEEPEDTDLSAGEETSEETATREIKKATLSYKSGSSGKWWGKDIIEIYHNSFRYVLSCSESKICLNRHPPATRIYIISNGGMLKILKLMMPVSA